MSRHHRAHHDPKNGHKAGHAPPIPTTSEYEGAVTSADGSMTGPDGGYMEPIEGPVDVPALKAAAKAVPGRVRGFIASHRIALLLGTAGAIGAGFLIRRFVARD